MNVFHFHPVTGHYLGSSIADPDPMELHLAQQAAFVPIAAAARILHERTLRDAETSARAQAEQWILQATLTAEAAYDQAIDDAEEGEAGDAARSAADADYHRALHEATQTAGAAQKAAIAAATAAADQVLQAELTRAQAAADAVEPAHWLIPAHATADEPPAFGFDQLLVREGDAWIVRPRPEETPAETPEAIAPDPRLERDARIEAVRWLIDRHRDERELGLTTTLTAEDYRLVLDYVQALRDVPEQAGFPDAIDWPVLPPELLATGA